MRLLILAAFLVGVASGCAQPKPNLQLAGKQQACVRECSHAYSACVPGASQSGGNRLIAGDVIAACNSAFEVCTAACPSDVAVR